MRSVMPVSAAVRRSVERPGCTSVWYSSTTAPRLISTIATSVILWPAS